MSYMKDKTGKRLDTFAVRPQPPRITDLPFPIVMPHRGAGALLAPENTMEALRIGASQGAGILNVDFATTGDGALIALHDSTLDRTTTLSGDPLTISSMLSQQQIVDAGAWFGGGWATTRLPNADEIFGVFGSTNALFPELKTSAAGAPLIKLIQRFGLGDSVMPNSFVSQWLAPFQGVCSNIMLFITSMPNDATLASYSAQGINWLGFDVTGPITAANVAYLRSAGFKIAAYTCRRHSDVINTVLGSDIQIWVADDPLYFAAILNSANAAAYRRTTDPFSMQSFYHGFQSKVEGSTAPIDRGAFVRGNAWRPGPGNCSVLQGWACPIAAPATQTIQFRITFDTLGSDATRNAGCFIGAATDVPYANAGLANESGYQCMIRQNGQIYAVIKNAGALNSATTLATTAISAPLTTTAALASGAVVTAIPVAAIPTALASGAQFTLPNGQVTTLSAAATAGATSLAINSLTLTSAIASGSPLPQSVLMKAILSGSNVTWWRMDDAGTPHVTIVNTAYRGAYWHLYEASLSSTDSDAEMHVSFSNVSVSA